MFHIATWRRQCYGVLRVPCRLEIHWSHTQVLLWPLARLVPSNTPRDWIFSLLLNICCPKSDQSQIWAWSENIVVACATGWGPQSTCWLAIVGASGHFLHPTHLPRDLIHLLRKIYNLNLHLLSSFTWGTSTADMVYTWRQKIFDPVNPTTKPWKEKRKNGTVICII